ncbi:MAG: MFS transporter [Alphaproteobacteria bacterium]
MARIGGFANIKRVLDNRNYRIFIGGNLCSNLGNWIQRVAVGWLTWQLTESAAWLGLITFADLFPTVLIGLIAGALVDRTDYLRMLKLTQTIAMTQAALLSLLTFADLITIELLCALTVLRGINTAFNRPARMSLIYRLVGRDTLSSAIALNAIIFNSARFVGPAAGGAIIVAGGVALAFACNALTFLVFLAALTFLRLPRQEKKRKDGRSLLSEAADGVRYALSHPGIGPLLIILVVTALFARPFTELLPGFADQVFGRGVDGLALLISANGLGAMAAGLWLLQRGTIAGLATLVIANLLLMACALLAFIATDIFWVAMPFLVVAGFSLVMQGVSVQTLIQTAVAGELRGRVLAVYGIVARGCPAIGALMLGGLSEHFGLRLPLAGGAAVCLLLWMWAARLRPAMDRAFEGEPVEARV